MALFPPVVTSEKSVLFGSQGLQCRYDPNYVHPAATFMGSSDARSA